MDQRKMQVAYEQGNIMKHNEGFFNKLSNSSINSLKSI